MLEVQFSLGPLQLKGTPLLVGFTGSNWASDPYDQKSTSNYFFTLGSKHITWDCKK